MSQNSLLEDSLLFSPLEEIHYPSVNIKVELFNIMTNIFNLTPRDINQVFNSLLAVRLSWEGHELIHLPYMLFLIMLKHKSDKYFNEYLVNKDISDIFKKLGINVEDNLIIVDQKIDHYSYNKVNINIVSILNIYNKLKTGQMYSNFQNEFENCQYPMLESIYRDIMSHIRNRHVIVNSLTNKYHESVTYAGQFL